jgi:hypothetical protein
MVVLAIAGVARAAVAGPSARLVYVRGPGAEQCPGEPAVRAAVAARLGYDPFFAWARDALFVDLTRAGGAFHVELKLVDADNLQRGARSLTVKGTDCSAVVDAMALTISLTIDPDSLTRGTPPPPPPPPEPPAPPPAPPPPEPAPAPVPPPPEESPPIHAHLGAAFVASDGAAPGIAFGALAFGGVRRAALSLDLEGRVDVPASGHGDSGVVVRSWIAAASLVPCVHVGWAYGCGVASAGWQTATAPEVGAPRTGGAFWAAAGPRLGLEIGLSPRWALRAWTEVLWTLERNSLAVVSYDPSSVYRFGPLSGDLSLGLAFRFP